METFPFLLKFDFTECFFKDFKVQNYKHLYHFPTIECIFRLHLFHEDYVITTTSDDVDSDSYIRSSLSEESI